MGGALVLAAALTAPSAHAPAHAQAQQPAEPRLRLASQTPWVVPGGELSLRVVVDGTVDEADTELALSVFRGVDSRSEFALTLEDRIRGSAIVTTATPLAQLPPDAGGSRWVRLPLQDPAQPADPARLRLREPGVYPVRVELRRTGGGPVLARFVTHLVYAAPPTDGGHKLRVGLVVPLHAAPALRPDGTRELPPEDRARLVGVAAALSAHPDVPLTLKPTPETLVAMAESDDEAARSAVATLAQTATGRQVVAATYVPVPPTAFTTLSSEAAAQRERGNEVLDTLLGTEPDPDLAVVDEPVDAAALEQFREQQVDRLVIPEPLLTPVDLDVTLTEPFELDNREVRRPVALAADAGLAGHFDRSGSDPVLAAHQLLADLAVLYFDRPGRSRGAVAMPPRGWSGDRAFLETVLAGLAGSPIVTGTTIETIFNEVPPATTGRRNDVLRRSPAPPPSDRAAATLPAERIAEARRHIRSFGAMLDSDNPRDDALEELLLVSQSADLAPRRRLAYLDGVDDIIGKELTRVRVPRDRSITLTARRGEIPITVLSEADYPVRVMVDIDSDKLAFPQGDRRPLELVRRNTTERFSVEARTSGAFPLRVRLTSPDGGLTLGETRFTVRSTAISGVGIFLSAGALVVLLAWWGRHVARGRRNRRLVPAT